MLRNRPLTCAIAAALLAFAGCGEAPPPLPKLPEPTRQPQAQQAEEEKTAEVADSVALWSPPYPQREDLFAPPQRSRTATRRSSGGEGDDESVQLLGFVTVDEPKAVLSIDGVVASVAAGAQKYGIEVITITPPEVVLQRGRNRWTTSLD